MVPLKGLEKPPDPIITNCFSILYQYVALLLTRV